MAQQAEIEAAEKALADASAALSAAQDTYNAAEQLAKAALGSLFTDSILGSLKLSPGDFTAHEIPAVGNVAKAKQAVDAAAAHVKACEEKLADLANFTSFADIKQLLDGFMGSIAAMHQQTEGRLAQIEERMGAVETQLTAKVGAVEAKVDALDQRLRNATLRFSNSGNEYKPFE
jgi:hypothetical protein